MPDNQVTPVMSPQERMAREYLSQSRFRKARDEFKLLCKVDRAKFLPLLVEANIGLAREMLEKGMIGEARQLLNYLRTIATADQIKFLEVEMDAPSNPEGSIPVILQMLAKNAGSKAEQQRLSDRAVLAFTPVQTPSAEIAGLAGELGAILSALKAISERQYEHALELIRPISQSSVFNHWKIFIKGLAAFHSGNSEKAARFLSELPAGSAPANASPAWLLLMGAIPLSNKAPLPSVTSVEAACLMAGEPGCGAALVRAEQSWRKKNPVQAYRDLRDGIKRFPTQAPDFLGVLSEFAINCFFTLPRDLSDAYAKYSTQILEGREAKRPMELLLFARLVMLDATPEIPDALANGLLNKYLGARKQLHGSNPVLESMAHAWLGTMMSEESEPHPFSFPIFHSRHHPEDRMRNAEMAQELLEKALVLDPENLAASLKLCEIYKSCELGSDRNRLLDRMTARFPKDKHVLLLAGQACLERKAFKKGIDYLTEALLLDQLDPAIPDKMVKAQLLLAKDYLQKKRIEDARKALVQADSFKIPAPENLSRSTWCLNVQQGVLELKWGDSEKGSVLLDQGRQLSPSLAAFLCYRFVAEKELAAESSRKSTFKDSFAQLDKKQANASDALFLTRIWIYAKERLKQNHFIDLRHLIEDYMKAASRQPFTREEARRIVEFSQAENAFERPALDFINAQLKKDPKEPLFRFYQAVLKDFYRPEKKRKELEEIIVEATRRKEDQVVKMARQELEASKRSSLVPPLPFEDDDGPFEIEPGEDDIPTFTPGMADEFLNSCPPEELGSMEAVIAAIANASDEELNLLRQTRPPGVPVEMFEMLINLARARKSMNPPKPKPAQPKRPNPNQPELF